MDSLRGRRDQISREWVEIFEEDAVDSDTRQCKKEDGVGEQESEWQSEDDEYLSSLTLIEKQQQWIDVGSYIIHKLRRRLGRHAAFNAQLVRENKRLHRELAALKGTIAQQKCMWSVTDI
ncbi:hypothetical protein F5879DRAFT_924574 [Lentinula edodes]|nr:hypothetical protein F5879DRAFT_924574 [Lentinula edodes]